MSELKTMKKLPLGGVDRRALVPLLAEQGPAVARATLQRERAQLTRQGVAIAADEAVLVLGGSNGITRAIALQLALAEGVSVVGVYHDSARLQIGVHHAQALVEAAARGPHVELLNQDATRDETVCEVVQRLAERFAAVHLLNGIASGAPKRYAQHGPTKVPDLDVAFDPILQIPDFSQPDNVRQLGYVEVGVATEREVERTNKLMGLSTQQWAEPLARAGLLREGHSVVALCDFDFAADDPVYAMGPLAGAKLLHRRTLAELAARYRVRAIRVCYPPMCTTALGAIPGGLLMYAWTTQVLKERGRHQTIAELAARTMALWRAQPPVGEALRLDADYQQALPEIKRRALAMKPADLPHCFDQLWE